MSFELTEADTARAQAIYDKHFGQLTPAERQQLADVLGHAKSIYTQDDFETLCGVTAATLDDILARPPAEAVRTHKALLMTGRGWMVGLTKSSDPWAIKKQLPGAPE